MIFIPRRHDVIANIAGRPAVNREIERASKHRPQLRRRWGGRLFAIGGFLCCRRPFVGRVGKLFPAATGHGDCQAGA